MTGVQTCALPISGVVQAINLEDGTVDVMISMFGRETAATLQLNQVIRQDD